MAETIAEDALCLFLASEGTSSVHSVASVQYVDEELSLEVVCDLNLGEASEQALQEEFHQVLAYLRMSWALEIPSSWTIRDFAV